MKLKKILKYGLIIWLVVTVVFVYLAHRGGVKIYGGLTKRVDPSQFELKAGSVAINNVNVLSSDGLSFIANQTVYIDDGNIVSVDTIQKEAVQTVDGTGKFLIPGLIDAHVHLFKSKNDLLLYLANGVTQIRELIGEEDHLTWREEIKNGGLGPDMYVASPRLGSFGVMEGWWMSLSRGFDNIKNAEEAKRAVRFYKEKGYDGIKIYSQLNKESYDALCKHAQEIGLQVMGHIPFCTELSDIYNSSQNEIAHFEEIKNALNREFGYYNGDNGHEFLEYIEERCDEVSQNLIKRGITVTSTMWGTLHQIKKKYSIEEALREVELEYVNPGMAEWTTMAPGGPGWLPEVHMYKVPDNLNLTPEQFAGRKRHWETYVEAEKLVAQILIKNGVTIMAGTDASIPLQVPGFSLHDELVSLNEAGMNPAQVLQSATSIPAEWMKTNTGKILPNRKANLVLLDKNPLIDIKHTQSINTVIINGKVLNRKLLDQLLDAVKQANDSSRTKDISQYM